MKKIFVSTIILLCFGLTACYSSSVQETSMTIEKKQPIDQPVVMPKEEVDPLDDYIQGMSLEEKVGQLFMIAIRKDAQGNPVTMVTDEVKQLLAQVPVGGIILFKENIDTPQQVSALISILQEQSKISLWIGVDEEGGKVSRVGEKTEFVEKPFVSAFEMHQDTNLAYNEAVRMGKMLKELGFNMDFAPVADIFNNPSNTVIGKRSFGTKEEEVTPMVLAFAAGLESENIVPVVKHFPGHGNTIEDSHNGLAYVQKSLEALEAEELVPFKAAIGQSIPALMIGHLVVPAVDPDYPASLSKKWGDYLSKMGTDDVILMTDAMEMGAITEHYTSAESALKVIESGYDMVLMPEDIQEAYTGVLAACREGKISEERIDKSVRKILSKKVDHHLIVFE